MMARYRKNRRKYLRGGNKPVKTSFDHNEPPTASEAVRQHQAGAANDAETQMVMNQSGGTKENDAELHVPQSGAASPEGNEAMAQSAGMLQQSRQNAPKQTAPPDIKTGGRRRKKSTKKKKRRRRKKSTKKKRKRKTKKKYKFAKKYHQRGCSRRTCKRR